MLRNKYINVAFIKLELHKNETLPRRFGNQRSREKNTNIENDLVLCQKFRSWIMLLQCASPAVD